MSSMMNNQTPPQFGYETQVRTDLAVYKDFKAQVIGLQSSRLALFAGDEPNLERVMSALFYWFGNLPRAHAEAFLAREFPLLEAFLRSRPEDPPQPEDFGNDDDVPKKGGRRKAK